MFPQPFLPETVTVEKAWLDGLMGSNHGFQQTLANIQQHLGSVEQQLNEERIKNSTLAREFEALKRDYGRLEAQKSQLKADNEKLRTNELKLSTSLGTKTNELDTKITRIKALEDGIQNALQREQSSRATLEDLQGINVKKMEQERMSLKRQHGAEMTTMKTHFEQEYMALMSQHETEMATMKTHFEQEYMALKSQHEAVIYLKGHQGGPRSIAFLRERARFSEAQMKTPDFESEKSALMDEMRLNFEREKSALMDEIESKNNDLNEMRLNFEREKSALMDEVESKNDDLDEMNLEIVRLTETVSEQSKFISERVTTVRTRGQRKKLHLDQE